MVLDAAAVASNVGITGTGTVLADASAVSVDRSDSARLLTLAYSICASSAEHAGLVTDEMVLSRPYSWHLEAP